MQIYGKSKNIREHYKVISATQFVFVMKSAGLNQTIFKTNVVIHVFLFCKLEEHPDVPVVHMRSIDLSTFRNFLNNFSRN